MPLAGLLSHATESVAAKTGDAVGGLLNATLGNLTELVIAVTALRAGMLDLVQASITGAVVTNSLFMLGGSFLLGGLRHRVQEFNPANARVQTGMLLLATIALLIPSAAAHVDELNVRLIRAAAEPGAVGDSARDLRAQPAVLAEDPPRVLCQRRRGRTRRGAVAAGVLAGDARRVDGAGRARERGVRGLRAARRDRFGMSKAFVGFIVVSLVGAAAEMVTAFSAARKNRLDLSVGIAMGSSAQIALFVAPVLVMLSYAVAPAPMDLNFGGAQVLLVLLTTLTTALVVSSGKSAWYLGVQLLAVYAVFAVTLYLLPN